MKTILSRRISIVLLLSFLALNVSAQRKLVKPSRKKVAQSVVQDSAKAFTDSMMVAVNDSALTTKSDSARSIVLNDTKVVKAGKDWSTWRPDPKRALWLALVLPGAGQIYNRKYWKLPIIYGGFMGCIYAMTWNNQMYKDYSQAFIDISDGNPATASYKQFQHLGVNIDESNPGRYKEVFKSRRDKYRRWRDLSFFVMLGVYALSVIDAYVDAELSKFDISDDLSLEVKPAVINNKMSKNPIESSHIGLECSLTF